MQPGSARPATNEASKLEALDHQFCYGRTNLSINNSLLNGFDSGLGNLEDTKDTCNHIDGHWKALNCMQQRGKERYKNESLFHLEVFLFFTDPAPLMRSVTYICQPGNLKLFSKYLPSCYLKSESELRHCSLIQKREIEEAVKNVLHHELARFDERKSSGQNEYLKMIKQKFLQASCASTLGKIDCVKRALFGTCTDENGVILMENFYRETLQLDCEPSRSLGQIQSSSFAVYPPSLPDNRSSRTHHHVQCISILAFLLPSLMMNTV
ncbi:hypothetical protein Ciccas_013235 [Cichlidogyrus casuarinus]|uniref:Uncharacterized protein n=1 Tax=Cichlidogyrus casuarinus TaxID=1844966 RepID=A0ABD2PL42_9PLAT